MAVGSVDGRERREMVATLFPDGKEGKTVPPTPMGEGRDPMELTQTLSHPMRQAVETSLPPPTPKEEIVLTNGVTVG